MAKLNREAAVRERRQRKKARKDARKQAAIDGPSLHSDVPGEDDGSLGPLATGGEEDSTLAPLTTRGEEDSTLAPVTTPGGQDGSRDAALVTPGPSAVEKEA